MTGEQMDTTTCSCPAVGRCYHIMAARRSIGLFDSCQKKKINLTQLRKNTRKKSKNLRAETTTTQRFGCWTCWRCAVFRGWHWCDWVFGWMRSECSFSGMFVLLQWIVFYSFTTCLLPVHFYAVKCSLPVIFMLLQYGF